MGRRAWLLWAIAGLALAMRLYLALSTTWIWDEDREWLLLASRISLEPGQVSLPVQGFTHPVLPAYFMRAGSWILGENPLGYRLLSLLAGSLTVLLAARLAARAGGMAAGAATGLALAFNEYHMVVSSVAVDMVFYLLFLTLSLTAFARFLREPAPGPLVLAGALAGLGYMCNERAALLIPILGAALLLAGHGRWLRRWPPWAGVAAFILIILPDLLKGWLAAADATQRGFSDHLARFSGMGLTAQPLAFFGKTAVGWLAGLAHVGFKDWAPEYPAMNEASGLFLLAGIAVLLLSRQDRAQPLLRTWMAAFGLSLAILLVLGTEYRPEQNVGGPQAWYWADLTLVPAALLAGVAVGRLGGWRRHVLVALLAAGCLVSGYRLVATRMHLPAVKIGVAPATLWPADGHRAEVRAGFAFCMLCDHDPEITLEKIEVQAPGGLRAPTAAEAQSLDGGRGRLWRLQAGTGMKFYGLHYRLRTRGGEGSRLATYVLIKDQPPRGRPMFWLPPPGEARAPAPGPAAPAPATAAGS